MDQYIRSRANSYSNIAFITTAMVIFCFGVEDYLFFNGWLNKNKAAIRPHAQMDYDSKNPPNLVLGGSGPFILLFALIATGGLFWAGYGAFVFHAGMTQKSGKWDICSVYTLVWLSLPYSTLNHLHCLKWRFPKLIVFSISILTTLTFWYPFKFTDEGHDANEIVPQFAGVNYMLLLSSYIVGFKQVKLRKISDLWVITVAAILMYFAKEARDKDSEWCESPTAFFQGHAVWHSSMAVGIMFFYFFLRQERPWVEKREDVLVEGGGEWMERVEEGKGGDGSGRERGRSSGSGGSENLQLDVANDNTML